MNPSVPVLEMRSVQVLYEGIIGALDRISLRVGQGEIVALLGANGSGKSTTLKAASGLLGAERGAVTGGEVLLRGEPTAKLSARELVQRGLVQVLEGRHCFPHLTVIDNLVSGTLSTSFLDPSNRKASLNRRIEQVFTRFPRLKERQKARAGLLSGGEQQMLAIGRALMTRPSVLLLDEPSMGLAPIVVGEIFEIIAELNRVDKVSIFLAEQNARVALRYAHRAVVLENGHVVAEGDAKELRERDEVKQFYLGINHRARRVADARTSAVLSHSS